MMKRREFNKFFSILPVVGALPAKALSPVLPEEKFPEFIDPTAYSLAATGSKVGIVIDHPPFSIRGPVLLTGLQAGSTMYAWSPDESILVRDGEEVYVVAHDIYSAVREIEIFRPIFAFPIFSHIYTRLPGDSEREREKVSVWLRKMG